MATCIGCWRADGQNEGSNMLAWLLETAEKTAESRSSKAETHGLASDGLRLNLGSSFTLFMPHHPHP